MRQDMRTADSFNVHIITNLVISHASNEEKNVKRNIQWQSFQLRFPEKVNLNEHT